MRIGAARDLIAGSLLLATIVVAGCGGGGDETSADPTLDQAAVTANLEDAGYAVAEAAPGQTALPSLVDVDFATGPDSGFEGAIQVSGNGLAPFDPSDVSETGFVLFYEGAESAAAADDSLGTGEGQRLEGNALFVYGTGLDPPPEAFDAMVTAAVAE